MKKKNKGRFKGEGVFVLKSYTLYPERVTEDSQTYVNIYILL